MSRAVEPEALGAFALALAAALLLMPVAIRAGARWGFVARPRLFGSDRDSVSYLGGIALATAVLVALGVTVGTIPAPIGPSLLGALALLLVGLVDDRSTTGVHPLIRIGGEVAIASLLWWMGLRGEVSPIPVIDAALTVFVLVASCNAFNLLDNMDGVAVSTAIATSAGLALLGMMADQPTVVVVAAALCGASLGFLRHNFVEARLFLGNGGALFMGLVLAVLALHLRPPGGPWTSLVPICVLAVPALDTGTVLVSRLSFGRPLFEGGLDHVSHRLVALGQPVRRAALMHGLAAAVGAGGAIFAVASARAELAVLVLAAFTVAGIALLNVKVYDERSPLDGDLLPVPETGPAGFSGDGDVRRSQGREDGSWAR
jgi:UDP-GlcNAc:undecaprenyl-phosphate GlcNAc-1-phosphate transferase